MIFVKLASTVACFALCRHDSGGRTSSSRLSASTLEPIENVAVETPGSKYQDLLEWLKSTMDAGVNEKLTLKPSTLGGGMGAFVSEPVKEGEVLMTIPRKACVSMDDVKSDPENGEIFAKLIEKAGAGGGTVALAGFLAKERLLSQMDLPSSRGSRYQPYMETLPWKRGVNNQEHMLFWSEEDVETYLPGTMCRSEALSLREEVALAITVLNSIVGKSIREARGEEPEAAFSFPWTKQENNAQAPPEGLAEAITGAFVCILTRAFQDGDDDDEKLVPVLDILQHSDEPNIRHAMRKVDGTVEVVARRDLEAGEELFNQYRSEEEESMPYHRFFTRYGFVPGITEPMTNLLKDKSTIFFAQKAEV